MLSHIRSLMMDKYTFALLVGALLTMKSVYAEVDMSGFSIDDSAKESASQDIKNWGDEKRQEKQRLKLEREERSRRNAMNSLRDKGVQYEVIYYGEFNKGLFDGSYDRHISIRCANDGRSVSITHMTGRNGESWSGTFGGIANDLGEAAVRECR